MNFHTTAQAFFQSNANALAINRVPPEAQLNVPAIVAMTTSNAEQDEFSKVGLAGMNKEIAEALKSELEENRKLIVKNAAKEIIKVVNLAAKGEAELVEFVRACRRSEAVALAALKELNLSRTYAQETGNYVPLLLIISPASRNQIQENKQATMTIPENYIPASETAANVPEKAPLKKTKRTFA